MPAKKDQEESAAGDLARSGSKAILPAAGGIVGEIVAPGIGGVVGSIVATVAGDYLERLITPRATLRLQHWQMMVEKQIKELEQVQADFRPENLADNDAFVSAVLTATPIAIRTHQQEKLDALRNAVLNTVVQGDADDDLRQIFFTFIDYFTPLHLRLLEYYNDPGKFREQRGLEPINEMNISMHLETAFPDYDLRFETLVITARDLRERQLMTAVFPVEWEHLRGKGSLTSLSALSNVTDLGRKFLAFIRAPHPPESTA